MTASRHTCTCVLPWAIRGGGGEAIKQTNKNWAQEEAKNQLDSLQWTRTIIDGEKTRRDSGMQS